MAAFMLKVGVKEAAYQRPITRWQELCTLIQKWDDARFNDAMSAELDGASSKSASSESKDAAKPDEGNRKAIKELMDTSQKAYGYLYEALSDELRALVKGVPFGYAYGLWKFMEDKFQNTEQDNIADLYKRWSELAIGSEESFESYKARVDEVNRLLEQASDKPSAGQYAYVVLDKAAMLQPKLKPAVLALRVSSAASGSATDRFKLSDPKHINWDEVVKFISNHERSENRMSDAQAERDGIAAAAAARTSSWKKPLAANSDWMKNKSSADIECHHCHEKGHIRPHCPKLQQQQQQPQQRPLIQQQQGPAGAQKQKCSKCGAGNHATKDHDESKVPQWRKSRAASRAAAAATFEESDDELSDSEEKMLRARLDALEEAKERSSSTTKPKAAAASAHALLGVNQFATLTPEKELPPTSEWASCAVQVACAGISGTPPKQAKSTPIIPLVKLSATLMAPGITILNRSTARKVPAMQLMAQASASSLKAALNRKAWGIDTMASVHICSNKSLFVSDLRPCNPVDVQVADGKVIRTELCGTVTLILHSADKTSTTRCTLSGLLYHPDFSVNLLSWVKLSKQGWELHSSRDASYLMTPAKKRIALSTTDSVLVLHATSESEAKKVACPLISTNHQATPLNTASDLVRMHELLGHIGFDTMLHALKGSQTDGIGSLNMSNECIQQGRELVRNCTACLKGKGTRTRFGRRGLARGNRPLQVLHMDSYVIVRQGSEGQIIHEYGVVIVDSFAEMIYFINTKTKDAIPQQLTHLLQNVMTQSDRKLQRIICDGGSEFINNEVKRWCEQHGVEVHPAPPRTPQLNGIAERHVRVLKEAARTLLHHSGLPFRFWSDATRHFVCTRNRSRIAAATGMTPHETVYGHKPSLQHLGVFGCDVYFHVAKQERRITMQVKMQPGIYLGYDWTHNCHRVYRLREGDVINTRDVRFRNSSFSHASALRQGTAQQLLNHESEHVPEDVVNAESDADDDADALSDIPEDDAELDSELEQLQQPVESGAEHALADEPEHKQSEIRVERPKQPLPLPNSTRVTRYVREQQLRMQELRDEAEQKAIDDVLSMSVVRALVSSASSGMHALESSTPKTVKDVHLHPRRTE